MNFLPPWWKLAAAGGVLLIIASLLLALHLTRSTLAEVRSENASLKAENRTLKVDLEAKEQAAFERAVDTARIDEMKKDLTDAIKDVAPGAAPGPATVLLGCERLRRAGVRAAALPAVCRSQSGK